MANNRMWIKHKISGKLFPLASTSSTWGVGMSLITSENIAEKLDDFFWEHAAEDQKNYGNNYEIVYEISI